MTEEEAKTKTCHLTLGPIPDGTGGAWFQPQACLGTQCMAWRSNADSWRSNEERVRWLQDRGMTPLDDPGGYCGLSGKP